MPHEANTTSFRGATKEELQAGIETHLEQLQTLKQQFRQDPTNQELLKQIQAKTDQIGRLQQAQQQRE